MGFTSWLRNAPRWTPTRFTATCCSAATAETGVAAEKEGDLVGFISGYIPPQQPETVFVWQVAVHEKGRGQGLAKRMLKEIVGRDACSNVTHLETTITEDNEASWALFKGR